MREFTASGRIQAALCETSGALTRNGTAGRSGKAEAPPFRPRAGRVGRWGTRCPTALRTAAPPGGGVKPLPHSVLLDGLRASPAGDGARCSPSVPPRTEPALPRVSGKAV